MPDMSWSSTTSRDKMMSHFADAQATPARRRRAALPAAQKSRGAIDRIVFDAAPSGLMTGRLLSCYPSIQQQRRDVAFSNTFSQQTPPSIYDYVIELPRSGMMMPPGCAISSAHIGQSRAARARRCTSQLLRPSILLFSRHSRLRLLATCLRHWPMKLVVLLLPIVGLCQVARQ